MSRIFLEQVIEGRYRLAMIDRAQIAVAEHPGHLGNVFECPVEGRTRDDDAQIFYTLAPAIGADVFSGEAPLNTWTITVVDSQQTNLFQAVAPLTLEDRKQRYHSPLSITRETTVSSSSASLFSLVAFSEANQWKSGVLQRCIDCLVQPQYRGDPMVYAIMDQEYRHIMRVHLERTADILDQESLLDVAMRGSIHAVRKLLTSLGLRSSVDTTTFTSDQPLEEIQAVLTAWSGSEVTVVEDGYRLRPQAHVLRGLSYLQPWLPLPQHLVIAETPL